MHARFNKSGFILTFNSLIIFVFRFNVCRYLANKRAAEALHLNAKVPAKLARSSQLFLKSCDFCNYSSVLPAVPPHHLLYKSVHGPVTSGPQAAVDDKDSSCLGVPLSAARRPRPGSRVRQPAAGSVYMGSEAGGGGQRSGQQ